MLSGTMVFTAALLAQAPAVPGGCTQPASAHVGQPGCYLSAELTVISPPPTLYWHIIPSASQAEAKALAGDHDWTAIVPAHGRWWLYVLSGREAEPDLPRHHVAGPLAVKAGKPVTARFMESWFPFGMRTRAHRHSGPEAFYVIDGEQCTETPDARRTIAAGESYVVPDGPHLQAAPHGRRSLVLILAPPGEPWMRLSDDWQATGYCDG